MKSCASALFDQFCFCHVHSHKPLMFFTIRLLFLFFCLTVALAVRAQSDSLIASDTIHAYRKYGLFSGGTFFSYYGTSGLTSQQLWPLLRQSDDKQVQRFTAEARRRYSISQGLTYGSYGLLFSSLATFRNRNLAPYLLLGAFAGTIGNIVTSSGIDPATRKAVKRYNMVTRSLTDGFAAPLVTQLYQPTAADTVQVIRKAFRYRFRYRGINIIPAFQLKPVQLALNTPELNNGFRHSRTLRTISGITTGIGTALLNIALLQYAAFVGYRQRLMPVNNQLYTSLGIIGTGVLLRHMADKSDAEAIARYNQLLRTERVWPDATY